MTAGGGIRFGQYVLLKRIARGGMAEVFLAQQRGLEGFDRRVAVKRILPHLSDAQDFVQMFLGEAKLAAQLTHPNVVHIYDFGKVEQDYFIAMEFVDGVHAGQIFKHGEIEADRLSPTLIARIGADAASALHYAHELPGPGGKPYGLVHRDVSPANLMISFDGAVKLCDFGIAKAATIGNQLTNPGQVKGKYAYMSPEQTTASPLDGRSDVFSLGIVLWELLAGRTIVGRGDAIDAMRAIRDGKLERIEKAAPKTPPALVKAVNWALETKREKRATAADLATALEAFIKSSPEIATPMQLAQWVRGRFVREMTGPQSANIAGPSSNTEVGRGTVVSTGTNLSVTPSGLIAASQNPFAVDDFSETVAVVPSAMSARVTDRALSSQDLSQRAAEEATIPRKPYDAADETTLEPGNETMQIDPDDDPDVKETLMRSGPMKPQLPPPRGSGAAGGRGVIDDRGLPPGGSGAAGARGVIDDRGLPPGGSGAAGARGVIDDRGLPPGGNGAAGARGVIDDRGLPPGGSGAAGRRGVIDTSRVRRAGPRPAILVAVLAAITLASFVIALAAKSCGGSSAPASRPPAEAGVDALVHRDVGIDAPLVVDAFEPPTIPIDAAPKMAFLEITTHPDGATVRIGDQQRTAPASFAIPAGTYHIVAELDGWEPEERDVIVEDLEHKVEEIAFFHKKRGAPVGKHEVGKLTVRTTPWSEVFIGNKKLGEAPFADMELPVGTYQITFKNPDHAPVTKKVPIVAGKNTKVQFVFP